MITTRCHWQGIGKSPGLMSGGAVGPRYDVQGEVEGVDPQVCCPGGRRYPYHLTYPMIK